MMAATPLIGLHQESRKGDCTWSIQNYGSGFDLDVMTVENRS